MEHMDERGLQVPVKPQPSPARQPVVAVNDIVVDFFCPHHIDHSLAELWKMEPDPVLVIGGLWTRRNVDYPSAPAQGNDSVHPRVLRPGKDIDLDPLASKLTSYLSDINVHAPCLLPPQRRQGTCMNTDHGNPLQCKCSSRLWIVYL